MYPISAERKSAQSFLQFIQFAAEKIPHSPEPPPTITVTAGKKGVDETTVLAAWEKKGIDLLFAQPNYIWESTMLMLLRETKPVTGAERWASFGSGLGLYEMFLASYYPQITMHSVEAARPLVETQRQLLEVAAAEYDFATLLDRFKPRRGSFYDLSAFGDNFFNRVFCIDSMQWVVDWRKALTQVNKVLSNQKGAAAYFVFGLPVPIQGKPEGMHLAEGLKEQAFFDDLEGKRLEIVMTGVFGPMPQNPPGLEYNPYYIGKRVPRVYQGWEDKLSSGGLRQSRYIIRNGGREIDVEIGTATRVAKAFAMKQPPQEKLPAKIELKFD